jgi:hypothetical protein
MAHQAKHHHGGKIKNLGNPTAVSNGPPTGMQKTPAPDQISRPRGSAAAGYGQSGGENNPSVIPPGKRVASPLALNLESSVDDDGVQAAVIGRGTARNDDRVRDQLRDIADKNVPTHPHMSGASKGPTIPATIGASQALPVPADGRRATVLKNSGR